MRLSLTLAPLLAGCLSVPVSAAGEHRLTRRAGLFAEPGFQQGFCELIGVSADGWISGHSRVDGRRAAWVTSPVDGVSRRVGLFSGPGFETTDNTWAWLVMEGGWVTGYSLSLTPDGAAAYQVPWMADGATGLTTAGGLTGPGFAAGNGARQITFRQVTENGFAWGTASRYTGAGTELLEDAVWVMNVRAGFVVRAGLFASPDYTDSGIGPQTSSPGGMTRSGWLFGTSVDYKDPNFWGRLAWVASAATGVTRRLSLPGAEFEGLQGVRNERVVKVTESGFVGGASDRYAPAGSMYEGSYYGTAAWVGDAASGTVRRVGFFGGPGHTDPSNGWQQSGVLFLNNAGCAVGDSSLYHPETGAAGTAVWVTEAAAGASRRVGLFEGEEFDSPSWPGTSTALFLTESGWIGGESGRHVVSPGGLSRGGGPAPWVAEASTGATRRLTLAGDGFTSSLGERNERITKITESGWVLGYAADYRNGAGVPGQSASRAVPWVAEAATGAVRVLGLTGPEYETLPGYEGTTVAGITEDGKVHGHTPRFRNSLYAGKDAWMADAATGAVIRLGLTEGEFAHPAEGWRQSTIEEWNRGGFVRGVSQSFREPAFPQDVPWVADTRTGETRRAGPVNGVSVRLLWLTDAGLAGGDANMPSARPGVYKPTAWVQDMKSGRLEILELSVRESDGLSQSVIKGVTQSGVAYGLYTDYGTSPDGVQRAFLWTAELGAVLLDSGDPGAQGPAGGCESMGVSAAGVAVLAGQAAGLPGQSVFFGNVPAAVSSGSGVQVTDLARQADGKFRLSFHTDAAARIILQSSADLTTWRDGQTMDAPAGASHMDIEPDPAAPNKYWRLKTGQ